MNPRAAIAAALLAGVGLLAFRHELWTVARPGEGPRPLASRPAGTRGMAIVDVTLPAVPVGMRRLQAGQGVLLIHYWAPWERNARDQIKLLDSLRREPDLERVGVVVVCLDPFPSVARFVARQRVRVAVLLDGERQLRRALPCPSIPYTYVLDHSGRIATAQAGEVDWWAPSTRRALLDLLSEPPGAERGQPL